VSRCATCLWWTPYGKGVRGTCDVLATQVLEHQGPTGGGNPVRMQPRLDFGCVLHALRVPVKEERRAPVQGSGNWHLPKNDLRRVGAQAPGTVAWSEHEEAWIEYARMYGKSQSAERIAERGGFSHQELSDLLDREPSTWRPL